MEMQPASETVSGRKRRIRIFFSLFVLLLVAFTLFSNTLMALTLPKVVVTTPGRGELQHTFQGMGTVKWREETALTGAAGGEVEKVHVKEGEPVKKGAVLVVYNQQTIEHQIEDEQANLSRLKLTLEDQQNSYKEASSSGDEKAIAKAKHDMKMTGIDVDIQGRKVQRLQKDLQENSELVAPFDGIVTKVNAVEGLGSSEGESDVIIANVNLGFEFGFAAPASLIADLEKEAKLFVRIGGSNTRQVEGRIEAIKDTEPLSEPGKGENTTIYKAMKQLVIALEDKDLKGGEQAETQLIKTMSDAMIVPNDAIHKEGDKSYVLSVEERNGPLGNSFFVRQTYITIIDSNEAQSAVEGLMEHQPIISNSSDPLQEGDKIRLH
ncbi:efflux RND transporter periplasmic adaptor subunit [Paenibacillus sp. N3/727]|uniref:efflux RND transporter periplasmic adaptor subunit n=1 Tax=Paenibacillus sp. N3/727 TaxID=2925845 RepID=UPI001F533925|nr:efflux RND transporter periplasmic adaptor subunit [Paenibacillus sp. N3/727]UNK19133.1 efflux RND transporter periplasmic adaptor subunit [Paenibacillus sp. N3/727]